MNRPEVAAHSLRIGACLLLLIAASASLRPAESHVSPHARVQAVDLGEARWTRGFWADRFETCRQHTIPSLWRIMAGTNHTHYFENFRIAAGLAEGRSRGAPFNDGDFYKWIEAVCALEAVTKEDAWAPTLDDVISVIARAQRSDGYLHTPVLIRQREGDPAARPFEDRAQFEMYNMGHLFTAAAVHFHATGKTSLLAVARKASDFLDQAFRDPAPSLASHAVCPSHYMGLIDLYRATGEPRHLALARKLFHLRRLVTDGGDDNQDRLPFERQTEALGHAVRANYLYAGAADLLAETGDPAVLEPLLAIWTNVVQRKLYITGGCGALHDGASPDGARDQKTITRVHQAYGRNYQLPHTTAHNETCAAIGNALWNWRMFLLTGEARFVDELERALYNGILSGISLDGARFFYANPLRQTDPLPVDLRWPRSRVPYLSAFCCPPNIARTLARSIGFAYAKSDRDIWANLYGGSLLVPAFPPADASGSRRKRNIPGTAASACGSSNATATPGDCGCGFPAGPGGPLCGSTPARQTARSSRAAMPRFGVRGVPETSSISTSTCPLSRSKRILWSRRRSTRPPSSADRSFIASNRPIFRTAWASWMS